MSSINILEFKNKKKIDKLSKMLVIFNYYLGAPFRNVYERNGNRLLLFLKLSFDCPYINLCGYFEHYNFTTVLKNKQQQEQHGKNFKPR